MNLNWMQEGMVVVDVETTGLDPQKHSMIEIGAIAWSGTEYYRYFRPRPGARIDQEALEVNGQTIESLDKRELGYFDGRSNFFAWLYLLTQEFEGGKLVIAGMNPHFDKAFLDAAWDDYAQVLKKPNSKPWGHRVYDLHSVATLYLTLLGQKTDGLNSDTLSERIGVLPESRPHDAANGVNWCANCFAKIHNDLRFTGGVE